MTLLIAGTDLTEWVSSLMDRWHVPGLSLSVIRNGDLVYSRAVGERDLGERAAMSVRTLLPIGSLTKPFVSNATAILVERGVVEWDAPARTYLPDLRLSDPDIARQATLRDFLAMRAGLDHDDGAAVDRLRDSSLETVVAHAHLVKCDGGFRTRYTYSGLSFCIAALILERVSGKKWWNVIAEEILQPLGMRATRFSYADARAEEDVSKCYEWKGNHLEEMTWEDWDLEHRSPAASMCSNLEDLTKWAQMLVAGGSCGFTRLMSPETMSDMMSPCVTTHYPDIVFDFWPESYGLGWGIRSYRGRKMVYHRGTNNGFRACLSIIPEDGIAVVVQVNAKHSLLPHLVTISLLDHMLENDFIPWEPMLKAYVESRGGKT